MSAYNCELASSLVLYPRIVRHRPSPRLSKLGRSHSRICACGKYVSTYYLLLARFESFELKMVNLTRLPQLVLRRNGWLKFKPCDWPQLLLKLVNDDNYPTNVHLSAALRRHPLPVTYLNIPNRPRKKPCNHHSYRFELSNHGSYRQARS